MFLHVLCLTCIPFLDFLVLVDPDDFTDATDKTDPGADILEENNVPTCLSKHSYLTVEYCTSWLSLLTQGLHTPRHQQFTDSPNLEDKQDGHQETQ